MFGLIFANGEFVDGNAVRAALEAPGSQLVVAADGGLRHIFALGLRPDIVIGDMDSAGPEMLARAEANGAKILRFPAAKNETDLELALIVAVEHGCDSIRVMAATGGRLDQIISNVYLLALPALRGCDARLVSGEQTAWLAYPGTTRVSGQPGDTLSLLPLAGDAGGIVTENLVYPLRDETLFFGPARGVSNVLAAPEASFSFKSGVLLAVHTLGRA